MLFYLAIDGFHFVLFDRPARALVCIPITLSRPVLTALGFAAAAALWRRMGRGSDGMTVPDVQLAVVRRMGVRGVGTLPVVDPESGRVVGVVHRASMLARYEREVETEDI